MLREFTNVLTLFLYILIILNIGVIFHKEVYHAGVD